MDQVKFDKLISAGDIQEQTTLKVLYNAVVKTINDLNTNANAVSVKDWETTKNSYEQYADKLWSKYFPPEPIQDDPGPALANVKAVADYLKRSGYKIGKSTIYNLKNSGALKPEKDGKYLISKIDSWAEKKFQRLDGSSVKVNDERTKEETRKIRAQADHWELKTKIAQGKYVPKDAFDRELAQRAMVFKQDIEAFCRSKAADIINLAGGDKEKIPDVIEFLLAESATWLNRYAADREFTVTIPPDTGIMQDPEDDEDAAEE